MICQRWRPDSYEPFVQRGWSICNLSTQASTPWGCTSPILGWVSTVSHRECAWMQLSWISLHGIDLASFYSTSREGWPCARQMLYIDSLVRRLCMLLQPNMTLACASRLAWPLLLQGSVDSLFQLLHSFVVYVDTKIVSEFHFVRERLNICRRNTLFLCPIKVTGHVGLFPFRLYFWTFESVWILRSCGASDKSRSVSREVVNERDVVVSGEVVNERDVLSAGSHTSNQTELRLVGLCSRSSLLGTGVDVACWIGMLHILHWFPFL